MIEDLLPPKTRETAGKWLRLPQSRRLVVDLLHFSQKVPGQPLTRNCNIAPLVGLRKQASPSIGWAALFLKAYSLVAARHPDLRRVYMPWPWAHVHEFPFNIARMTVSRSYKDEDWVFFARLIRPELLSLTEIQQRIADFKQLPIEEIPRFRLQVVFSRFPRFLRRLAWWVSLNVSGYTRAARFGTFGMTTVSARGAISIRPPSILTTTLTFGPVDPSGDVRITLVYDHRLLDGGPIADCLAELEETLNGPIVDELRQMIG